MKSYNKYILGIIILILVSCQNEPVDPSLLEQPLEEVSPNDPNATGLNLSCPSIDESPYILDSIAIDEHLPISHDLSPLMPPVRSQGSQASCVAWATTYYLKSYQEKIQHGYEYSFSTLMSPAFVFNQTKVNCSIGSCIDNALLLLKRKGVCSWSKFPYSDEDCSTLPNASQFSNAAANKISQGYVINSQTIINNQVYLYRDIIKNLVSQGNPVIIAIGLDNDFVATTPKNEENIYIYKSYNASNHFGYHCMLIVGYDDELNAFKVINSWGTGWGDDGYCWISYNFFIDSLNPDFKAGLLGAWVAFD